MELDWEKYKQQQFCDNPSCEHFNQIGQGNIGWNSRKQHQVYCKTCRNIWVITKETFFFHLKTEVRLVLDCLLLLSEGTGVNAVCRLKGVSDYSLRSWIQKAAQHLNEVSFYLKEEMHLEQCQIDEFWAFILKKSQADRNGKIG